MPQISRFFGIIISMYFDDHNPPHFHARYGDDECIISIQERIVLEGRLPPRALGMVIEWANLHHDELLENWTLMRANHSLNRILPLN